MDPSEIEFIAEKEIVTVVPNFSYGKIYLIGGDVGPFIGSIPVELPLWLAVNLKQRQKCRIIPPEWMNVERLEEKKQDETESKFFTEMPNEHYMEMTQILLNHAANDIPRADQVRTLIKDIWDLRIAKLRSSIDVFIKSDERHAMLNHLTVMEINTVRSFLTQSLDNMHVLRTRTLGGAGDTTQD
ncbi:PREDICTED: DNA replication complex GINS protein PSF2-like [Priapulus caudatus]|uniref:DNA replication complex GINS protein PSF2 n=1 Tax=Priapulus caudatus TaxID=37621 RepID=A0ABM1EMX9_PRICU|nr:PREDICTED: DNA replication complex GINS protein PSF2-like [Priapulus caudatus]